MLDHSWCNAPAVFLLTCPAPAPACLSSWTAPLQQQQQQQQQEQQFGVVNVEPVTDDLP
jgi:hypothetical protein